MGFYKLREWVWTVTGKGDRWEGNSWVGPSPLFEWPAPPHSLHQPALHGGRPANFCWLLFCCEAGQLNRLLFCCEACTGRIVCRLCLPAAALFSRLCLPCPPLPCLACSPLPCHACCPHRYCPPGSVLICPAPCSFPCVPGLKQQFASCKNCPVGSYNAGLQWRPVRRFLTAFSLQSP